MHAIYYETKPHNLFVRVAFGARYRNRRICGQGLASRQSGHPQ